MGVGGAGAAALSGATAADRAARTSEAAILRADADTLALAADIDPAYAAAFSKASAAGVEMLAYACTVTAEEVLVTRRIPIAD